MLPQNMVGATMRISSLASVLVLLSVGLTGPVAARSLSEAANPSELPPANYTGRQYVDSAGCVYVRAGFEGNVKWVPRVTRQRQVVCGQSPTFGNSARQSVVAAAAAPAPAPAPAAAAPQPRRVTAAAAPRPAAPRPQAVRRVAAAPRLPSNPVGLVIIGENQSALAPVTPQVPTAKPRTVAKAGSTVRAGGGCGNSAFRNPGARCGPQAQDPSSGVRVISGSTRLQAAAPQGGAISIRSASGNTRIVPVSPAIPQGFRPAWDDGRLNPYRGLPQSAAHSVVSGAPRFQRDLPASTAGYDLAWTKRAPHLLFDRRTGIVVGDKFPQLTYPNVTLEAAAPAPAQPVRSATARVSTRTVPTQPATARLVPQPKQVVAAPRAPQAALAHRHIQVATFANPSDARSAAQRLANAGLPTRIGSYTRSGEKRQVIVLGPFASQASLNGALGTARQYGFTSAFSRK